MPNIAFLSTAHSHSKSFLAAVAAKEDCRLVAIWDDMASRGQDFAAQYGTDYADELAAVIGRDDVDGFIICAENTRHLPLLQQAIPAGKPIFCEKPFTTTAAEAKYRQPMNISSKRHPLHQQGVQTWNCKPGGCYCNNAVNIIK